MEKDLAEIESTAKKAIETADTPETLENLRIQYLGRERGAITAILRSLKDFPPEKRKKIGEEANRLRREIESVIEKKQEKIKRTLRESILKKEWIDVTRPGIRPEKGHIHPMTKVLQEVVDIFSSMGFAVAEGPEVETEYYNFDALNIPANHPARDTWNTFWIKTQSEKRQAKSERLVLRTHTSPVQIRYMEKHQPPIRIIVPGRVYRYEATDATHDIQFYQVEGLMIDKNISVSNFKAIIQEFFSKLFGTEVQIRLRPSYFPFTEPSFEVDISCVICSSKGCSACKYSSWLEIMGAGMVHPNVFKHAGYNPKHVQGFAFGLGLDRIVMMKYKIPDVRLFHSADVRFLKQF